MFLHPFLKAAVTFARFQSSGMLPSLSVFVKRVVRIGVSCTEHSFRSLAGIVSGPEALCGLICCRSFSTPSSAMAIAGISGAGTPGRGTSDKSSLVNTDLYTDDLVCCLVPRRSVHEVIFLERRHPRGVFPEPFDVTPEAFMAVRNPLLVVTGCGPMTKLGISRHWCIRVLLFRRSLL